MPRHVAPHRWADAAAGRLSDSQRASCEAHASRCGECAAGRDRVYRSRAVFAELRCAEPPDLHWDHIGARIYWVTSSEQRAAERDSSGPWVRWQLAAAGFAAAAVAGLALLYIAGIFAGAAADQRRASDQPRGPVAADTDAVGEHGGSAVAPIERARLRGVITYAAGDVTIDGDALDFDTTLTEGATIATGQGHAAIQFGDGSGFSVAPRSELTLRVFDERSVVLVIDGTVRVDLAPRADGQSFAVVAGNHTVAVRGTRFEVDHRDGALGVICSHGRVQVSDGDAQLDVAAGYRLSIGAGAALGAVSPSPFELDAAMERQLSVAMVPVWAGPERMLSTTAWLDIDAPIGRSVRVDGIGVGSGELRMRVAAGRHLVETESSPDTWLPGQWIKLAAGTRVTAMQSAQPPVEIERDSAEARRIRVAPRPAVTVGSTAACARFATRACSKARSSRSTSASTPMAASAT